MEDERIGATKGATGATWDFFLSEAPIYEGCNILSPSLEGKVAPILIHKKGKKEKNNVVDKYVDRTVLLQV